MISGKTSKRLFLRQRKSCVSGRGEKKETWWWSNEVQDRIKAKKSAYKEWQTTGHELEEQKKQKKNAYRVAKKEAKEAVPKPDGMQEMNSTTIWTLAMQGQQYIE